MEKVLKKSVYVAMSGGVDSSVAAWLLKERGFSCVGATMRLYSNETLGLDQISFRESMEQSLKTCCAASDMEDAASVCGRLGIPHEIVDYKADFRKEVIDKFIRVYEAGGTPNPCIDCNRYLKFGKMLEDADNWGLDYIATGHYARVERDEKSGRYLLKRGKDAAKDQSYVLYNLSQEQLSRTIFPLGELTKDEVREIAEKQGFRNAHKHESQDICFVPDGDYAAFIERSTGKVCPPGDFVEEGTGRILGRHKGVIHYTVGQRKGLGIAAGKPVFVQDINPSENTVTVGDEAGLFKKTVFCDDVNLIAADKIDEPLRAGAKLRYRMKEAPCTASMEGGRLRLDFDEPQRAPTAGQAAVLYLGDTVLGGGTICGAV